MAVGWQEMVPDRSKYKFLLSPRMAAGGDRSDGPTERFETGVCILLFHPQTVSLRLFELPTAVPS